MALLHNRVSQRELKERLYQETEPRTTISFYQYFPIDDPAAFRDELYKSLNALNVFGRIYVAHEGINAQLSVPRSHFELMKNYLYSIEPMNGVRLNSAIDDDGKSFWVLKIKVRDKIVADGITDTSFSMINKGKYVNAEQMNQLMNDEDTVIIDMRNHYEYEVGHFENALEIPSDTFKQQLPMAVDMMKDQKNKKIIMYCTGGIRCEKASAYMLHNGFKNVFHLEGGIINYARQAKELGLESKFIGKNFVFDDRLGERITEDIIAKCHQCGKPADTHTNCVNSGCHLLFIQCDECAAKYEGCCSQECLDVIHLPEEEQKKIRAGIDKGRNIFNKSKLRLRRRLDIDKTLFLMLVFLLGIYSCKNQTDPKTTPAGAKIKLKGYEVDPGIEQKAMSSHSNRTDTAPFAMFDVAIYEDDKLKDVMFLSGSSVPHLPMYQREGDSVGLVFVNLMGGGFGLTVILAKDTCHALLGIARRNGSNIFRMHPDSSYERSIAVQGKSLVILSRLPFDGLKPLYGYLEYTGDEFFEKSTQGEIRKRVEFKGYFKVSPVPGN